MKLELNNEDLKLQKELEEQIKQKENMYSLDGDSDDIGNDSPDELIIIDGIPYIDSRTIAKQIGRKHHHLIRDIRRIIEDKKLISEKPNVGSLYLSSTYKVEGQNRKYNNYLI